ncbi:response regulator [Candidatus Lokiarchaeum ossiferum]
MVSTRKILIVEDDFITSKGLEALLDEIGYIPLKTVSTGVEALEAVKELNPDVVLMDMFIKGNMNGLDTALKIVNNHAVPIIFTTAFKNSEMFKKIEETGLFDYVLKPYTDGNEIIKAIESHFTEAETLHYSNVVKSPDQNL